MENRNYLRLLTGVVATLVIFFAGAELFAQSWYQTAATSAYTTTTGKGVIRMLSATSAFTYTGAIDYSMGRDDANYIAGIVDWARTSGNQPVQQRSYDNIVMSGASTKAVTNGFTVLGSGYAAPPNGYADLTDGRGLWVVAATGNRTYGAVINYWGAAAQDIYPENGANRYNSLNLDNSTKTVRVDMVGSGEVEVANDVTSSADAPLQINDLLSINITAGTGSTIGAALTIGNGTEPGTLTTGGQAVAVNAVTDVENGWFNVAGAGNVNFDADVTVSGAATYNGTIRIVDAATGQINILTTRTLLLDNNTQPGDIDLGSGTTMNVTGAFTTTVAYASRTNLVFDPTSTVNYNAGGAQTILGTIQSNDYGNLTASTSGDKTAEQTVYMAGNLSLLNSANIIMGTDFAADPYTLFIDYTGAAGNKVTIATNDNTQYVQGKMAMIGTIPTDAFLTMNNFHTRVQFSDAPDNFGLQVYPGTEETYTALQYTPKDAYDRTKTLRRLVRTFFDQGTGAVLSGMEVGYLAADQDGTFAAPYSRMRIYEGYDAAQAKEKFVGVAGEYTASANAAPGYVQLDHAINLVSTGTTLVPNNDLTDGADLVLSAGIIQTIANGRWSDPATWDEGVVPAPTDDAVIRHTVFTGDDQQWNGSYTYAANESAFNPADPANTQHANSVIIIAPTATFPNTALVISDTDVDQTGHTFAVGIEPAGGNFINPGFWNNNTTGAPNMAAESSRQFDQFQGIWTKTQTTGNNIQVNNLYNSGSVINNGIIAIGIQ